jgi:hypothetical protein
VGKKVYIWAMFLLTVICSLRIGWGGASYWMGMLVGAALLAQLLGVIITTLRHE